MEYKEIIQNNLMNNYMDRKEMVKVMLETMDLKYEEDIVKQIKLSPYGKKVNRIFNEKDYFDFICYSYLLYVEDKTEKKLCQLTRDANMYLSTFSDIDNVMKFEDYGTKFKLALEEKNVL